MHIRVLGSAAGGGFPQWNCACFNCNGVRSGRIVAQARTQESVAVSANGTDWIVLNASPEIRQQVEGFAGLHPSAPRHTPIQGIVLTNGDLDHCLGLLSLRESQPLRVYTTEAIWTGFTQNNVLFRTLCRFDGQVTFVPLVPDVTQACLRLDGRVCGLEITALRLPGKLPIHLAGQTPSSDDNIGLIVADTNSGKTLAYFPAVAAYTERLESAVQAVDALFFDGTFWSSDELIEQGLGDKRAQDMAHWPVGGRHGSLEWLQQQHVQRRVLIHVNNTNPILRDDATERRQLAQAGIALAYDGMELVL